MWLDVVDECVKKRNTKSCKNKRACMARSMDLDEAKEQLYIISDPLLVGRRQGRYVTDKQCYLSKAATKTKVSGTSDNLHTAFFHWTILRDKTYKLLYTVLPTKIRVYFCFLHVCTGATSASATCVLGLLLLPPVVMTIAAPKSPCTKQRRYISAQPSTPKIEQAQNSANVQLYRSRKCFMILQCPLSSPEQHKEGYKEKEVGKVVLYSTTMGVVRKTYQDCVKVKKILRNMMVKYEERDVFMSREVQSEVRDRMNSDVILVPQMFVEGQHIGSCVQTSEPSLEQNLNIPAGHILLFKVMHISG
uniref:Glutaredoxin domain-containing protein n=1 Tax=Timema poppense TaxID=170557 RepID=A0A7R9H138_TIMPO|nr:unnamed protein product [Timema poppensis]